jgi:hypothetical protein
MSSQEKDEPFDQLVEDQINVCTNINYQVAPFLKNDVIAAIKQSATAANRIWLKRKRPIKVEAKKLALTPAYYEGQLAMLKELLEELER